MNSSVIYLFPLVIDIVVSLALFIGRHRFAEQGLSTAMVGAVAMVYGGAYVAVNLVMGRIIKRHLARQQMLVGLALIILLLCLMAGLNRPVLVLVLCGVLPFATGLFFNAFQSYMLQVDADQDKPLSRSIGNYTLAWSIGFALGPIVSALVKQSLSWSMAYLSAAGLAFLIGLIVLFFKPRPAPVRQNIGTAVAAPAGPAMPLAGWLGILVIYIGWTIIATFWPVQAAAAGFPVLVKGGVEFVFALSQALTAFAIARLFPGWYHRPAALPWLAACGVAGLCLMAFSRTPAYFMLGGFFYGMLTGSGFIYLCYHAMADRARSVRRIAVNEICFGITLLVGPVIGNQFYSWGHSIAWTYLATAVFLAAGTAVQTWLAAHTLAKIKTA